MIRIKIIFKPSSMNPSEGVICYRISKDGMSQLVKTENKVLAEEWDDSSASVFLTHGERSAYLIRVQQAIERDVQRLHDIARRMQREGTDFSALQVVRRFLKCHHATSLFSFMQQLIGHLKLMGKVRTSETYTAALHSFMQFRKKKDVALEDVDADLMQLYEAYLLQKGLTKNSCSFYMRILRATYNRAVEKGLTMQRFPFKHVYTGVGQNSEKGHWTEGYQTAGGSETGGTVGTGLCTRYVSDELLHPRYGICGPGIPEEDGPEGGISDL